MSNTLSSDYTYKTTILLDPENNWLEAYIQASQIFNHPKHMITITHDINIKDKQDLVIILGYTKILNSSFLDKHILCAVVHESALPKGKGFAPVQWQILEGKHEIPICLIEADKEVDSGNILLQQSFKLTGYELYDEIRKKQAEATLKIISDFLEIYPNIQPIRQEGTSTFYKKRTPKDGKLDVNESIRNQFNLLRIGNNEQWPSYFEINNKKYILKIYDADDT